MPNHNNIQLTDEAYNALEANKSEGFSFKRLASEAIIEKYGSRASASAPMTGRCAASPEPNAEDMLEAARLLAKHGGDRLRAIGNIPEVPNQLRIMRAIDLACGNAAGGGA